MIILKPFFLFTALALMLISNAQAVEYTGRSLRDPFSNTGASGASTKDEIMALSFTLEGVVWNTKHPQAIINSHIVQIGSKIENTEILDIQKEGVKMRYKGEDFFLRKKKEDWAKQKT